MAYEIYIADDAQAELDALGRKDKRLVEGKITSLAGDPRPHGVKALKGKHKGLYRLRSGNFRIIYQIKDKELKVLIVKVGDRRDVYD